MQRIKIQRQGAGAVFNPTDQMVDTVTDGGSFIFENNDSKAHHPKPDAGGVWMDQPIAAGQPSTLITAKSPGRYPYTCSLHSSEKGVVTAPHVVTIQTELIATGFNPQSLTLAPATDSGLFVFLNLDQSASHRPQPDDPAQGSWFKQDIAPGKYSPIQTLTAPGTYKYHCAIHPGETGTITVPAPPPAT